MSDIIKKEKLEVLIEPHIFKNLKKKEYSLEILPPSLLLTWNRLDLAFKLFFLDNRDKGKFVEDIYAKHIKAFTLGSFEEYGDPNKDSIIKYIDAFYTTLNDMKGGFDDEKSIIPLSVNQSILNGAHRIASAIYLNKTVSCVLLDLQNQIYDYRFFIQRHVPKDLLEIAVTNFIEHSENAYIAFIWPTGQGFDKELESIIPNIIYRKEVLLNRNGAHNLLSQIYYGEDWLGDINNNFSGSNGKLVECFKTFDPIRVIAFQEENLDNVLKIKDRVRDVFNVGKHSIHITDTKQEAIRTARIVFNDNSIHFLNFGKPNRYKSTHEKIGYFKEFIHQNKIDNKNVIIDSSLILSVYGLREASDIDYLADSDRHLVSSLIEPNDKHLRFYSQSKKELIYNPRNYFYFNDIKFISFPLLYKMKKKRGEIKDKNDLKMMDALIENNQIKKLISKWNQYLFYFKVKNKFRFMKIAKFLRIYKIARWFYRLILK